MSADFKKYSYFLIFLIIAGCLEDPEIPSASFGINDEARLLYYLEKRGDYINSGSAPSIIEAAEVYANLNDYLVIDVRSQQEFINGHIPGALNIQNTDLLNYFLNNNINNFAKVVLVSQTGQSAAYYTCLLILSGYQNVFSMNFGLASWNIDFAGLWQDHSKNFFGITTFNNTIYQDNDISPLPDISFSTSLKTSEEKLRERVRILLNEGFKDNPEEIHKDYNASILIEDLFNEETGFDSSINIVCYGNESLYLTSTLLAGDPLAGFGHPPGTVFYSQNFALRSTEKLQSLPLNKMIVIYSYSGQLSAYAAAYLRILGYDVKSLLFGANNLFYSRMIWNSLLVNYAFTSSRIMNYPYVMGNEE
ncbi:MAG TPA: rhodanese-like domain-containing protein [Ignavibacteriaceae bacterium]|nr:rhodanese-like domain-containing protein [Ignavibacteriaceae bacterium]